MRRRGWLIWGVVGLVGVAAAFMIPGLLDMRADDQAYERMLDDPVTSLVPPSSEALSRTTAGPCGGESDTGPTVITALSSELATDDFLEFYRSELEQLGWSDVSIRGDQVTGHRNDNGYDLEFQVYADSFEDVDYWAVLRTDPRQNCLLPFL